MRTLTYGGAVSLDGFLAGADGAIDWLHFSKDVQQVMSDYWKDIDGTLAQIAVLGGVILEAPHLDSPGGCWIATFRDPAGNVFGLYQEAPR